MLHCEHVTKSEQVWQLSKQPAHIPPSKKYLLWQVSITAIEHDFTPVEHGIQLLSAFIYKPVLQVIQILASWQILQPKGHLLHKLVTLSK